MKKTAILAGFSAGAIVAGGLALVPSAAQAGGVPDCSGQFGYSGDVSQECRVPGTSGMNRTSMLYVSVTGAGGGGGYDSADTPYGGDGAVVNMALAAPAGQTLEMYVAKGGVIANGISDAAAGGGGSTALLSNGTVIAVAGGGGGAGSGISGSDGGDAGSGPDGSQGADGSAGCSGKGGNQSGSGSGGAGGPLGSCSASSPYPFSGAVGGTGLRGAGGAGGSKVGTAVLGTGGWGYASGGDAGTPDSATSGAGGGAGYGAGGGGAADGLVDSGKGSGGGGGSYVDSAQVANYTISAAGNGGAEGDGGDGSIEFLGLGPSAVTQAKAPDVTKTTATTYSLLNPEDQYTGFQWTRVAYSTDKSLQTGVKTVEGDPATTGPGLDDVPITAQLTDLKPGTQYCYQIQGKRQLTRPSRNPRTNDEPNVVGAIECFTTASEPSPTPTPTPTPTPDDKKNQKPVGRNALPKSVKKSGTTVIAPANAVTNASQKLRTRVRCVPLKSATAGEVRYCSVNRKANGKVTLTTFGRSVRVIVVQTAAATTEYKRYVKRTVYVNGEKR